MSQTKAAPISEPLLRSAEVTPLGQHAVMESVCLAGTRVVAVGERGIVLLSDDEGQHWRQVQTPVSVTLTAVQFVDAQYGWAVGHSGVVLFSEDGGAHWLRQLDGEQAAQLALSEARTATTLSTITNAQRLVREGADKPFLSLSFVDRRHGTIVGAYGLAMHTDNGGRTWQSWVARMDDGRALHLYAVRQRADKIWVVGEQGFIASSADGGATFERVQSPYKGSFFALDVAPTGTVTIAGLGGNAYRTNNNGASFTRLVIDGSEAFTDVWYSPNGEWLISNQTGQVFQSRDDARNFASLIERPLAPVNGVVKTGSGAVISAGFGGVNLVRPARQETAGGVASANRSGGRQ
ncbi:MAG TPA: YCF48-related protein [Paraburkholderia sp.]|uniref:WD40/YVTN/BNR-like repeat-containing protein n=1 Tax=Paraburkholderia sp. TaxID=1926495 RepID=UPI002B492499|nr:YCF48-related protein [Paraburkholderia sp.]HKR46929.1 YCF48-related protein [Paraburkholderia sp.]